MTNLGPSKDLHSGVFGGMIHEPMIDLVHVMSKLVSTTGEILVPGLAEHVAPLLPEEEKLYDGITFSMDEFAAAVGSETGLFPDTKQSLQHR